MIRPARVTDVPAMAEMINEYARRNLMLPRPVNKLYETVRDYVVVEEDGVIAGCAGLHVLWYDLAEIRSVAVREGYYGRGYGRKMVTALMDDAKKLGIYQVFMLVLPDGPLSKISKDLGFREVSKETFPQKVWNDCLNCPKFTCCDEIALIAEAGPKTESPHEWHSVMAQYTDGSHGKLARQLPMTGTGAE